MWNRSNQTWHRVGSRRMVGKILEKAAENLKNCRVKTHQLFIGIKIE